MAATSSLGCAHRGSYAVVALVYRADVESRTGPMYFIVPPRAGGTFVDTVRTGSGAEIRCERLDGVGEMTVTLPTDRPRWDALQELARDAIACSPGGEAWTLDLRLTEVALPETHEVHVLGDHHLLFEMLGPGTRAGLLPVAGLDAGRVRGDRPDLSCEIIPLPEEGGTAIEVWWFPEPWWSALGERGRCEIGSGANAVVAEVHMREDACEVIERHHRELGSPTWDEVCP